MKPKKARKLIYFLYIIGFILILLSYKRIMFLPIGVIVAGSSVVPNLLFTSVRIAENILEVMVVIFVNTAERVLIIKVQLVLR